MPSRPVSDEDLKSVLIAFSIYGKKEIAAQSLKLSHSTFRNRLRTAQGKFGALPTPPVPPPSPDILFPELPGELPTAEELVQRRKSEFSRKSAARLARHLIDVQVKMTGPVGLALFGDPHIDDPGSDIALIEAHAQVVRETEGMFGACVGDYSNNWIGRLARLYGQQSTSQAEAWVLVEWFIKLLDWLMLVAGNHDVWSGEGDPIKWMAKIARVQYEAHGARVGLKFPNGRVIRLNARHDFTGKSQYNTAHGPAKAAQMGWRDHILVCGHLHTSGYNVLRDPSDGLISHALRVGSYKTFDRYAEEKGLPNQTFTVCPVAIIRPQFEDDDTRQVTIFFEPETAAEFLTFLRGRKSEPGV